MIPEQVRAYAVTVRHTGFADRSYHAARAYFEHYSVTLPSTPLLQPEFNNPLFLKLFCQSLSGKTPREIPSGFYGISEVFSGLLDDVNTRLSTRLDYNPNDKHVHAALVSAGCQSCPTAQPLDPPVRSRRDCRPICSECRILPVPLSSTRQ